VEAAKEKSSPQVLLGDEAVALGAVHAGVSAAYAYPGTPSTEIVEFLVEHARRHGGIQAFWSANEKTAVEEAVGVSMVGRRALAAMKHVGLNVAADPFMNAAIVSVNGGLVLAVADDPGMHSSQNEQDSRYYADFAHVPCFEPTSQQEAYDMTREAFEVSERFRIPVLLRLVTRLAHSRAPVEVRPPLPQKPVARPSEPQAWILLPSNARVGWRKLLERWPEIQAYAEASPYNLLSLNPANRKLGVLTTGLAYNYYGENLRELGQPPSHLHLGAYPIPVEKVRALCAHVAEVLVLEEGYPYVERYLRGLLPTSLRIRGKVTGEVPLAGELTADVVREALGLEARRGVASPLARLPGRPPQLCQGCPHSDTFVALNEALRGFEGRVVTSDIGCYTLAALPPYQAIDSCLCMGASVSMAKGAADAGSYPVVAVIGDSTFLHSGLTPLLDAVAHNADMTLVIVDNSTTAMTGGQPTILATERVLETIRGMGVHPEHLHLVEAHPKRIPAMTELLRREIAHHGLSVVIARRECLETARRDKRGAS
jgi:indolepyruvate ferredoxin oxidoreductase alpha subunit